jgi:lipopolysaccharide transport system ATP-binding protein
MSDTVIRVESLGKRYLIDHQQQEGYRSLRDVLANTAKDITQRFNSKSKIQNPKSEEFWALKDVSFEVNRGDRIGIIGRNGAGKSTLLKILSRITEPTEGRISLKGRVASLLEVGTGFHPELTGRENIYLNGAILGMSKVEIRRKFDEIVAFAEIEKFLDTPVKRYSSGMYVRLAFAVAAHLEPEILIVDEVLAVGDAAFQKKCLGKMENISKEGRTILFVSHNMAVLRALCSRAILLRQGKPAFRSSIEEAISEYLTDDGQSDCHIIWDKENAPQSPELCFMEAFILNDKGEKTSSIDCRKNFSIVIKYQIFRNLKGLRIGFFMQNFEGIPICGSNDPMALSKPERDPGEYVSKCTFPSYILNSGKYSICFGSDLPPYTESLITTPFCLGLTIEDVEGFGIRSEKLPGILRPKLDWKVELLESNN